MRTDKDTAFSLRRQGKTYNEISFALNVPKSTLSNWFKGVDFSEAIKQSLMKDALAKSVVRLQTLNRARGDILAAHYAQAEQEAMAELATHLHEPLFVAGVVAYWGEGDKLHKNHVRLTNTDPEMLSMFVNFLYKYGKFDRDDLRLALFIYEDLDIELCKQYWTNKTGITRVHKPQILPSRDKQRRLAYGTATVIVMNTYFKKKLLLWIDQIPKMVLNTVPSEEEINQRP